MPGGARLHVAQRRERFVEPLAPRCCGLPASLAPTASAARDLASAKSLPPHTPAPRPRARRGAVRRWCAGRSSAGRSLRLSRYAGACRGRQRPSWRSRYRRGGGHSPEGRRWRLGAASTWRRGRAWQVLAVASRRQAGGRAGSARSMLGSRMNRGSTARTRPTASAASDGEQHPRPAPPVTRSASVTLPARASTRAERHPTRRDSLEVRSAARPRGLRRPQRRCDALDGGEPGCAVRPAAPGCPVQAPACARFHLGSIDGSGVASAPVTIDSSSIALRASLGSYLGLEHEAPAAQVASGSSLHRAASGGEGTAAGCATADGRATCRRFSRASTAASRRIAAGAPSDDRAGRNRRSACR